MRGGMVGQPLPALRAQMMPPAALQVSLAPSPAHVQGYASRCASVKRVCQALHCRIRRHTERLHLHTPEVQSRGLDHILPAVQLLPGTLQKALQQPRGIDPAWRPLPRQEAQPLARPALRTFPAQLQPTSLQARGSAACILSCPARCAWSPALKEFHQVRVDRRHMSC